MQEDQELLIEFCDESLGLLRNSAEMLEQRGRDLADAESLNAVFRAVHTIKGNAGFFGLADVEDLSHLLEDALAGIQQGAVELNESLAESIIDRLNLLGEAIVQAGDGASNRRVDTQESALLRNLDDLQRRISAAGSSDAGPAPEFELPSLSCEDQIPTSRHSAVALREEPVERLFLKSAKLARALAERLGKRIAVHVQGGHIEIDKALSRILSGALLHLVRNVCDHALETPDWRQARGAAAGGNLWLHCALEQASVVVSVRDDGRGIDVGQLRREALKQGLYSAEQAKSLPDDIVLELVFRPGFSTARRVSRISGRGVGLDAVRAAPARMRWRRLRVLNCRGRNGFRAADSNAPRTGKRGAGKRG